MLTPSQADELIAQHLTCLPIESLPLAQCAGAVLRENVYAERDQPPFDRVMMDGVALDSAAVRAGLRRLRVQALQAAGDARLVLAGRDHCIEVMTGTPLPTGCDSVVPVEQIEARGGEVQLSRELAVAPGQNVHPRGSDSRQGSLLLGVGTRLGAPEIAVAASAGMARVRVSSEPMLAVISTGNELVEPGEPVLAHQVRRSNAYAIAAALRLQGYQRVADDHILDDAGELKRRLKFHLETHDVLVLSGGVSMGRLDLVPGALEELGVRCIFHKVAQRPGKPLWFGIAASGSAVFALPGNPVSTAVCVSRYVLPALAASQGRACARVEKIALAAPVTAGADFTRFLPVRIECDEWGRSWAVPCPTHGSGDFTSLAGTDGFVELPPGAGPCAKGFVVRLFRW